MATSTAGVRQGCAAAARRLARASRADRVEERPRGGRDRLRHERPDIIDQDHLAGPVERELRQLPDRQHAHPAAVDVPFDDEAADTTCQLLRRARLERDPGLPGARLHPARELSALGRLQVAGLSAGRHDGGAKLRQARRALAPLRAVDQLDECEAVARRDLAEKAADGSLGILRSEERTRTDQRDERPAAEHRFRADQLDQLRKAGRRSDEAAALAARRQRSPMLREAIDGALMPYSSSPAR
jgi:hypothetical protein